MTNHSFIKISILVLGVAVFWANAAAQVEPLPPKPDPRMIWRDYWAERKTSILPPLQYDYPFNGRVIITRMPTSEDIRAICPNAFPGLYGA
jgi:hypothetical protein